MNKPLTMIIKETKSKLANICNESGLSPIILELILQGFYNEIHRLAEMQTIKDENDYLNAIRNENKNVNLEDNNSD